MEEPRTPYPPIEPHATGALDVGDDNHAYREASGNPVGTAALALHDGPGLGCVPGMRHPLNPDVYRVILRDQRGCGRSTPNASDQDVDLSTNTTDHLILDIELLRHYLGVDRWVIAGWSWGTTLPEADRPVATLHIVEGAGHSAGGPISELVIDALDRFRDLGSGNPRGA